jgi:hypothetical protein
MGDGTKVGKDSFSPAAAAKGNKFFLVASIDRPDPRGVGVIKFNSQPSTILRID